MKKLILHIVLLYCIGTTYAQIHEVGVFVGGSNVIGDVGNTTFINPNEPAFGVLYKYNRSTRHAWRFSYALSEVSGLDSKSDAPNRKLRDFNFENQLHEFSAGLEFNFLDFDLHQSGFVYSPYIFTGFATTIYNENYYNNNTTELDYRYYTFAIPIHFGIKARISRQLVAGLEAGARYTFTDNIDGSNPRNDNFAPARIGNLNNKDWYVFSGFTLTYTFGKNPCFCNER
jgi:hypothetical protein